jgi:membrane protein implicated in regulation of membrane protease activity
MRLGPLEIVLIIVVIIAIAVIARIARSRDRVAGQKETANTEVTVKPPERTSSRVWDFLNKTGIVLVVGGLAAFIAAVSLFRMVLQSYLWAFILMAVGLILVIYSRKKR